MKIMEGHLNAQGCRFGIVVSKFNDMVTGKLLSGAVNVLTAQGAREEDIEVVRVPGAFEIPLLAHQLARSRKFDAIVCLGAVIRGETPHFDYICTEASRGIARASWDSGIPIIFGVLTTDTVEQALERAGGPERNRGAEAARSAIEMATLLKTMLTENRQSPGFQK